MRKLRDALGIGKDPELPDGKTVPRDGVNVTAAATDAAATDAAATDTAATATDASATATTDGADSSPAGGRARSATALSSPSNYNPTALLKKRRAQHSAPATTPAPAKGASATQPGAAAATADANAAQGPNTSASQFNPNQLLALVQLVYTMPVTPDSAALRNDALTQKRYAGVIRQLRAQLDEAKNADLSEDEKGREVLVLAAIAVHAFDAQQADAKQSVSDWLKNHDWEHTTLASAIQPLLPVGGHRLTANDDDDNFAFDDDDSPTDHDANGVWLDDSFASVKAQLEDRTDDAGATLYSKTAFNNAFGQLRTQPPAAAAAAAGAAAATMTTTTTTTTTDAADPNNGDDTGDAYSQLPDKRARRPLSVSMGSGGALAVDTDARWNAFIDAVRYLYLTTLSGDGADIDAYQQQLTTVEAFLKNRPTVTTDTQKKYFVLGAVVVETIGSKGGDYGKLTRDVSSAIKEMQAETDAKRPTLISLFDLKRVLGLGVDDDLPENYTAWLTKGITAVTMPLNDFIRDPNTSSTGETQTPDVGFDAMVTEIAMPEPATTPQVGVAAAAAAAAFAASASAAGAASASANSGYERTPLGAAERPSSAAGSDHDDGPPFGGVASNNNAGGGGAAGGSAASNPYGSLQAVDRQHVRMMQERIALTHEDENNKLIALLADKNKIIPSSNQGSKSWMQLGQVLLDIMLVTQQLKYDLINQPERAEELLPRILFNLMVLSAVVDTKNSNGQPLTSQQFREALKKGRFELSPCAKAYSQADKRGAQGYLPEFFAWMAKNKTVQLTEKIGETTNKQEINIHDQLVISLKRTATAVIGTDLYDNWVNAEREHKVAAKHTLERHLVSVLSATVWCGDDVERTKCFKKMITALFVSHQRRDVFNKHQKDVKRKREKHQGAASKYKVLREYWTKHLVKQKLLPSSVDVTSDHTPAVAAAALAGDDNHALAAASAAAATASADAPQAQPPPATAHPKQSGQYAEVPFPPGGASDTADGRGSRNLPDAEKAEPKPRQVSGAAAAGDAYGVMPSLPLVAATGGSGGAAQSGIPDGAAAAAGDGNASAAPDGAAAGDTSAAAAAPPTAAASPAAASAAFPVDVDDAPREMEFRDFFIDDGYFAWVNTTRAAAAAPPQIKVLEEQAFYNSRMLASNGGDKPYEMTFAGNDDHNGQPNSTRHLELHIPDAILQQLAGFYDDQGRVISGNADDYYAFLAQHVIPAVADHTFALLSLGGNELVFPDAIDGRPELAPVMHTINDIRKCHLQHWANHRARVDPHTAPNFQLTLGAAQHLILANAQPNSSADADKGSPVEAITRKHLDRALQNEHKQQGYNQLHVTWLHNFKAREQQAQQRQQHGVSDARGDGKRPAAAASTAATGFSSRVAGLAKTTLSRLALLPGKDQRLGDKRKKPGGGPSGSADTPPKSPPAKRGPGNSG